jgi:endonuclease/exonuclease/phosphatase family metal-dependent hydrolase
MKKVFTILTILLLVGITSPAQTNKDEVIVRVLTFNILHGATTKGDFDLDKIASVIKDANPDFVALQEVDFKTRRARNYDLATELGWRTKMAALFGKAMNYDGGAYGEAVLSRFPITASRNIPLPHSPGNEPRAALEITVELESGDHLSFIGTHLEHQKQSSDRIDQVKKINEVFLSNKYPTILAGDLNDLPDSRPISILKQYWTNVSGEDTKPTFPSNNPTKKIDYVFYRPQNRWKVVENKVICDVIASDHCAVLTVLKLKSQAD